MSMKSSICILLVLVFCASLYADSQMVGGLREEKSADKEIQDVVAKLKADIIKMSNRQYKTLEPVSYRKQVVAGLNYFIKVKAIDEQGKESHIHIRAYKPFRGETELTAVKNDVEKSQPLAYFQ